MIKYLDTKFMQGFYYVNHGGFAFGDGTVETAVKMKIEWEGIK